MDATSGLRRLIAWGQALALTPSNDIGADDAFQMVKPSFYLETITIVWIRPFNFESKLLTVLENCVFVK